VGPVLRGRRPAREFRATPTASWTAAGLDGPEIGIVSERYSASPAPTCGRGRGAPTGSTPPRSLDGLGWLEGDGLSALGRAEREAIGATDQQLAPALGALGDDSTGSSP
jgi:hypothetical protein